MRWRCLLIGLTFFLFLAGAAGAAAKKPASVAELALYNGPDRQEILEEGAKKEGTLLFYTAGILKYGVQAVVDAFQKKYPYIKAQIWRAGSDQVIPRIIEEHKTGKHLFDALEGTQPTQILVQSLGIIQPYYSPNLVYIEEGGISRAPGQGVFSAAFRENGIVLGYNTKLIAKGQVPKTYHDLLDQKWRGKVAMAGTDTGQNWVATLLTAHGEGFVKQIAEQKFAIHVVSAAALLDMVANGEYTFSPTLYDNHLIESKRKGAPVDWVPLEPAYVTVGKIAISAHSAHPHAALLFADFELSKESAEIHRKFGHGPTRKDVQGVSTFRKFYGAKTREEVLKWDELFNRLFLKR